MNWYYWVIIIAVLVVFYVLLLVRQKKQEKQNKEMLDSFKAGDKVVTHIGIYGKIKRIYNTTYGKVCVLEIGTNQKMDIEIDMRYIAGKDEKTAAPEEPTVTKEPSDAAKTEAAITEPQEEATKSKKSKNKTN